MFLKIINGVGTEDFRGFLVENNGSEYDDGIGKRLAGIARGVAAIRIEKEV